jgi:hypothetical protein
MTDQIFNNVLTNQLASANIQVEEN